MGRLQAFARLGVACVQRRELEIAPEHVADAGQDPRVRVDAVEHLTLVDEIGESARALLLMHLDAGRSSLLLEQLLVPFGYKLSRSGSSNDVASFCVAPVVLDR
jgi:hypothetical protein